MSIGEAIKAEIERQGLTAYRVAKMAGIKPDVVSRFLSGERGVELLPAPPRSSPGCQRTTPDGPGEGDGDRPPAGGRSCAGRPVLWSGKR